MHSVNVIVMLLLQIELLFILFIFIYLVMFKVSQWSVSHECDRWQKLSGFYVKIFSDFYVKGVDNPGPKTILRD